MKHLLVFILPLVVGSLISNLAAQVPYFQQSVNYRISATLDDQNHLLHANLELDYTNNSPDTLTELYFHLWPRAFRSDNTAFARQQLRDGNTRFHFSTAAERGDLDSLNFAQNGQSLNLIYQQDHPDIAVVQLAQPLLPGQTTTLSTPFRVKIPVSFSRLGHVGESYQMTQWYPKPAVYDRDGWHPLPYLDRGEFFSEFGSFDVQLTVPENYLVAATGELQNQEERNFLLAQAEKDLASMKSRENLSANFVAEDFPPSSTTTKTLRYTADRVHDFAWFADKRFKVLHDRHLVPDGEEIDVWSFFTETEAKYWVNSISYLKDAIRFYSENIGAYPYPQVTGVQSALSAGGGMEYPMITVIGQSGSAKSLDEVLAHEVGHNWFYGILATNERTHPWMDEGINSYYEGRYMEQKYGAEASRFKLFGKDIDIDRLGYLYQARQGKSQSPNMDSDSMSANNYWMNAYSKPDLALQHFAALYGSTALQTVMQEYYRQWSFKHPSPADLQAVFKQVLGDDYAWLFQGYLQSSATTDIVLQARKDSIRLVRIGAIDVPGYLTAGDKSWRIEATSTTTPKLGNQAKHHFESGPLDLYPGNNYQTRALALQPGMQPEQPEKHQLFWALAPGYNTHDGVQLGPILHNRTLEPRLLEWIIAPQYGFRSKQLNGFTGFRLRLPENVTFLEKAIRQTMLSAGFQTYGHRTFNEEVYRYRRMGANLTFELRHPEITGRSSSIELSNVLLAQDAPDFSNAGEVTGTRTSNSSFQRLMYRRNKQHAINPSAMEIGLELGQPGGTFEENFAKLTATVRGGYQYADRQWIRWRAFGGYFLSNPLRSRNSTPAYAFSLVDNAATDYRYDDLYLGRNTNTARYEQQIGGGQGGFRAPISPAFGFGRSNDYLAALNLDATLPFLPAGFPVGVFLDAATYGVSPIRTGSEAALQWTAGLSLSFLEGRIGIYAPLLNSPDTKNLLLQRGNVLQRLSIRLQFSQFLPWKWLDGFSL